MFELIKRENLIFDILQRFIDENLKFIVVGGYGISAYKHRFSIDADLIIIEDDRMKFEVMLKKNKFFKTIVKDLDHVYAPQFIRYEIKGEFSVSVDLLIGGIGSRTTNASYSFNEVEKYSKKMPIIGIEKEINVLVPEKEILIVLKLHSGRLTDFRDVAALCKDIDINLIRKFIWRGKSDTVKDNIKKLISLTDKKEFIDSFKGVFMEKKYDIDVKEIKKLEELI